MRRAIEESDYDALLALYADNAELRTVNKNSTPSSPQMLQGKEEISEMLRDVCGRAMTHHVEDEVIGEGRVAYNEACEYPDGIRACYELGRKPHRNAHSTVALVPLRSPFPA